MTFWDNFKPYFGNPTSQYPSEDKISAQGISDMWKLTDPEFVKKVKKIVNAIDEDKIKVILDTIEKGEDGYLDIKINLKVKRQND